MLKVPGIQKVPPPITFHMQKIVSLHDPKWRAKLQPIKLVSKKTSDFKNEMFAEETDE